MMDVIWRLLVLAADVVIIVLLTLLLTAQTSSDSEILTMTVRIPSMALQNGVSRGRESYSL